ncbi:MAG: hypothetical protein VXW98_01705, partial [Actinomycetota bacterium]|nr:hypothetical protein [Actinomycetota bacterium]
MNTPDVETMIAGFQRGALLLALALLCVRSSAATHATRASGDTSTPDLEMVVAPSEELQPQLTRVFEELHVLHQDVDELKKGRLELASLRREIDNLKAEKRLSDERFSAQIRELQINARHPRAEKLSTTQNHTTNEENRDARLSRHPTSPFTRIGTAAIDAAVPLAHSNARRQTQHSDAGDCDAAGVCTARIITRTIDMPPIINVSTVPHRGRRRARRRAQATACDFVAQSAVVMDACCNIGGASEGHRRAQVDCPLPAVCPSMGCAEAFEAFYTNCRVELTTFPEPDRLASLSTSCDDVLATRGSSLAQQLDLECTDGSVENCVPPCNAYTHGFILLLNIGGSDSKYSCNLAHGNYSWLGAASQGGFIGSDPRAFLSSILSGAAGTYAVQVEVGVLLLGIDIDVVVRPGQKVRVVASNNDGTSANWGSGTITVQDQASLELVGVRVTTRITVAQGGASSFYFSDLRLQVPLFVLRGADNNKMTTLSFEDTTLNVAPITPETFDQLTPGIIIGSALTMDAR